MSFAGSILSRPHIFTIGILVANLFLFLLMWGSNGLTFQTMLAFRETVLIAYGAKLNVLINEQHQWWRFITPMFLHAGLIHLLVNMYALWNLGPYVEKLYGSARFVFFWVVTGIAGVVASYLTVVPQGTSLGPLGKFLLKTQDVPSVGASGALFGLVGVLFVFGIKFRHELPEGFKRAFGTGLLPIILLNLFIGYMGQRFIDNAAHLGGLISGAALALVVGYRRPGERSSVGLAWQILQVISIALVLISFARVAQHFTDPLPAALVATEPPDPNNPMLHRLSYLKAIGDGDEIFHRAVNDDFSQVEPAIAALEAATPPDVKSDQLRRKLQDLLRRSTATKPEPSADPKQTQQHRDELWKDYLAWKKEYEAWLKSSEQGTK